MGIINAILGRDDPPEEVIQDAKSQIALLLIEADLKPGEDWEETEDGFLFKRGSALILIKFVVDEDEIPYVTFHSPIVQLPPDNLLVFYRRLLELNSAIGGQVAIGVDHDTVEINAIRSVEGLTEQGIAEALEVVSSMADDLDDYLHDEFGAPFFDPED